MNARKIRPLRIAILAPTHGPINQSPGGGVETFVYQLATGLTSRGHKVTLYTSSSSDCPVEKYSLSPLSGLESGLQSERLVIFEIGNSIKMIDHLTANRQNYDVIHNNQNNVYTLAHLMGLSGIITTLHVSPNSPNLAAAIAARPRITDLPYIAITDWQSEAICQLYGKIAIKRVHNGVDINAYLPGNASGNYIAWLGRLVPEKGPLEAIDICRTANVELRLGGSSIDPSYADRVKEHIQSAGGHFLGQLDTLGKNRLFGQARALLFPISWDEPFGLVMIEAMACGTPVIAYNRGAVAEIVEDGVTGILCPPGDTKAMVAAVRRIMSLPEKEYQRIRQACRQRVEKLFSLDKMLDRYEEIYVKITSGLDPF